jgi:hypothetical protein
MATLKIDLAHYATFLKMKTAVYYIYDLKLALREGVRVFEALEQDTIRQGSDRLLAVLQNIPPILQGFYARLSSSLKN